MEGRGLWTCREKSVSAFQYSQVVPRAFCPRITSPSSGFFSSSCHYLWKSGKRRIVAIFRRKVVFIIKSIFRDILILLGYLKYVVTSTDLLRVCVCVLYFITRLIFDFRPNWQIKEIVSLRHCIAAETAFYIHM